MLPEEPGTRRQRVARGLGVRLLLRLEGVLGERGQKVDLQRHVVVGDVPAQRRLEAALPVGRADFQGARLHDQPLVGRVDRLPGRRRKGGGAHEQARVLGLPSAQPLPRRPVRPRPERRAARRTRAAAGRPAPLRPPPRPPPRRPSRPRCRPPRRRLCRRPPARPRGRWPRKAPCSAPRPAAAGTAGRRSAAPPANRLTPPREKPLFPPHVGRQRRSLRARQGVFGRCGRCRGSAHDAIPFHRGALRHMAARRPVRLAFAGRAVRPRPPSVRP